MKFLKFLFSIFIFILFALNLTISIFTFFDSKFLTDFVASFLKGILGGAYLLTIYSKYLVVTGFWSILINSFFFIVSFIFMARAYKEMLDGGRISHEEKASIVDYALKTGKNIKKAIKIAKKMGDIESLGFLYLLKGDKLKAFYYLKNLDLEDFGNKRDFLKVFELYKTFIIPFVESWKKKSSFEKFIWRLFNFSSPNPEYLDSELLRDGIYRNAFYYYLEGKRFYKALEVVKEYGDISLANVLIRAIEEERKRIRNEYDTTGRFFINGKLDSVEFNPADLYKLLEVLYDMTGDREKKSEILLKQEKIEEAAKELLKDGKYRRCAEVYYSFNKYEKALEVIDNIEDENKKIEELLLKLKILIKLGLSKKAIKFFKKFEDLFYDSQDFNILMDVGKLCSELKLGDDAMKFLKKAESIDPIKFSRNDGALILGELMEEKNAFEGIEKNLEVYSETNPKFFIEEEAGNLSISDSTEEDLELFDSSYVISGRYELIEELGRGGAGVVYLARDRVLDRKVAIKELKKVSEVKDDEKIKEFFREARLLAKLNHPNIVQVYDILKDEEVFEDGSGIKRTIEKYYIVMELVEGMSLESIISEMAPMKPENAIPIILKVLDGLYFAHRKDVVHMDIKPANILITYDDKIPKITDFGIAKAMFSLFNPDDKFRGTPKYVSPEVILGKTVDERADIYSLGVTFFEMLTGEIPYDKNVSSVKEFIQKKINSKPYKLSKFVSGVDEELERIVLKSLAHDPDDRYSSAISMKRDLEKYLKSKK